MRSADTPRSWARSRRGDGGSLCAAVFAPGEAYQFDWSHEIVLINGVTVTVKVAHVRLCHSRMMFVRAYPRETQEMVFDAHERAFAFFKGACTRGIYDNMKTAVETVFVGKDRQYNRRFLQMCGHHLVEPVACTPASGWEKGQVENQVGLVRERFFTPRLRFKTYEELNAWLLDKCVAYAKAHRSSRPAGADDLGRVRGGAPQTGRLSRPLRRLPRGAGLGVEDLPRCASTTTNTRWLPAPSAGRSRSRPMPTASSFARTASSSPNMSARFGRGETIYDPWHYVPVLARKPGALRNGAPFQDWVLPSAMERVRRKLKGSDDGDRQMVVDPGRGADRRHRCGRGRLPGGARPRASTPPTVIINILARQRDPAPADHHSHPGRTSLAA